MISLGLQLTVGYFLYLKLSQVRNPNLPAINSLATDVKGLCGLRSATKVIYEVLEVHTVIVKTS